MRRLQRPNIEREIGARIRLARVAEGLSQAQLGRQLGLSDRQVQKYERGRDCIRLSAVPELARALGRPAAYFLDGDSAALAATACLALPGKGRRGRAQASAAVEVLLRGTDRAAASEPVPP